MKKWISILHFYSIHKNHAVWNRVDMVVKQKSSFLYKIFTPSFLGQYVDLRLRSVHLDFKSYIYICVCVCVCVCVWVGVGAFINVYICACVCISVCFCISVYKIVCVNICPFINVRMDIYLHTFLYTHINTHIYIYV